MRIIDAHTKHHRIPIDQPVKTAFGTMRERHAVLLIVEDDVHHLGVGESWVNFPAWAPWERTAAFKRAVIPWLKGREIAEVPTTISQLYRALVGQAVQSGTVGPLLQTCCAVELALWDLQAQRAELPLSQLLYRHPLEQVTIYASGINSPIPWDLIDQHLDWGVRLFKLKLGFGDEEDRRNLGALNRYLDGRAAIAVDVNRAWSIEQALNWIDVLGELGVAWLEEPLTVQDEPHLAKLAERSAVPIAGGENVLLAPGCDVRRVAQMPFDIVQPDLTKYAPLHMAQRLINEASAASKRIIPHFLGSGPGGAASLQFAAGCPEGLLEWDININPLRTDLLDAPFQIREGCITIPSATGLGWRLRD